MVTLELKPEEADVLGEVLGTYLTELRMEVADTDSKDYRERLKAKEVVVKRLLETLEA